MRLINADVLKENVIQKYNDTFDMIFAFMTSIDKAPTIDAVPVTRCEDCYWWDRNSWGCAHPGHGFAFSTPDFFCADGKLKEGDK